MLPELGELRPWFEQDDAQVTLYLTTEGAIENAAIATANRWGNLRQGLRADGAPDSVLRAIDEVVPGAHRAGVCLAAFGDSAQGLYVEHGPEPPPRDFARCDSLPAAGLALKLRQARPSFVVVLADRRGADITTVSANGSTNTHTVEGTPDAPIRKVQPGGWSQRRYQRRAANTWEQHAREIAADVTRAVDDVRAELVVVAGDVREVQLLEEHLPPRVAALIEHAPGGRAHDGSDAETEEWVHRWVATAESRTTVALLERFREERGQHDRAVEGPEATLRALTNHQVATLLVHDDWDDARRAFFARGCVPASTDRADPVLDNAGTIRDGRVVDVAIGAALSTGADIRMVPAHGGPAERIGALLRWT